MSIPTEKLNNVPNITFESGEIAEAVLDGMKAILKSCDYVLVADYRRLADLDVTHEDFHRGWNDLDEARIIYSRGEYMLDLPLVAGVS